MNYWKLGCKWGRGNKPDFYPMLREHGIAIGYKNVADIRKGDIVAISWGFTVRALALALEDAEPCIGRPELEDDFDRYEVDYNSSVLVARAVIVPLAEQERLWYRTQKGIVCIRNREIISEIDKRKHILYGMKDESEKIDRIAGLAFEKKNIVVQGAPGTGKTYFMPALALKLAGEDGVGSMSRDVLMNKYREYVDKGRIAFVTFHQSMDYEDFIEGLKPELTSSGNINYVVEDGIFKKLSEEATTPSPATLDSAYAALTEELAKLDEPYRITTAMGRTFGVMLNGRGNLTLFTGPNLKETGTITRNAIVKQYEGTNQDQWRYYAKAIISDMQEKYGLELSAGTAKAGNYVLIIDEINRGNISKIFGELITLIEADKRAGMPNAMEATLPYSKERFSVPKNLYIIATMNTTDRSVGSVDYAVRRRFGFITFTADRDMLVNAYGEDALNLRLFDAVRSFIEKNKLEMNIDDLMVGHSYFMADAGALESRWEYEIRPLLCEYAADGIVRKYPEREMNEFICVHYGAGSVQGA